MQISTGIWSHLPLYSARQQPEQGSASDHAMPDAKRAHRFPGYLPQLLSRAPDSAGFLYGDAQIGVVPIDADSDKIMNDAIWPAGAATPRLNREGKDVPGQKVPY
jgi:hypothetical protein